MWKACMTAGLRSLLARQGPTQLLCWHTVTQDRFQRRMWTWRHGRGLRALETGLWYLEGTLQNLLLGVKCAEGLRPSIDDRQTCLFARLHSICHSNTYNS